MVDWIWGRYAALTYALLGAVGLAIGALLEGSGVLALMAIPFFALLFLGVYDFFQKRHAVLANFPLLARFRFMLESIRPELRQYFLGIG